MTLRILDQKNIFTSYLYLFMNIVYFISLNLSTMHVDLIGDNEHCVNI